MTSAFLEATGFAILISGAIAFIAAEINATSFIDIWHAEVKREQPDVTCADLNHDFPDQLKADFDSLLE